MNVVDYHQQWQERRLWRLNYLWRQKRDKNDNSENSNNIKDYYIPNNYNQFPNNGTHAVSDKRSSTTNEVYFMASKTLRSVTWKTDSQDRPYFKSAPQDIYESQGQQATNNLRNERQTASMQLVRHSSLLDLFTQSEMLRNFRAKCQKRPKTVVQAWLTSYQSSTWEESRRDEWSVRWSATSARRASRAGRF